MCFGVVPQHPPIMVAPASMHFSIPFAKSRVDISNTVLSSINFGIVSLNSGGVYGNNLAQYER